MKQEIAPVISNHEILPSSYLMWLEPPDIACEAKPGQFVMVRCEDETILRRPFSIHQRNGDSIAILYTPVGKGTKWLSQRQTGDKIDLLGPLGNGFTINPSSKNLLLVAGGIGIAPLCFLAKETSNRKLSIKMLAGASTSALLYPQELLPCETETATEDGTSGLKGLATGLVPGYVNWADQIFACGPMPMYREMYAKRAQMKGKPVQISLEVRMGCGFGVCFGCTVKTRQGLKQVCQDGPVFDLEDICWGEMGI